MAPIYMLFPEGRSKSLTFSYDDGVIQDKRLVELFNKYNLKARGTLKPSRNGLYDNPSYPIPISRPRLDTQDRFSKITHFFVIHLSGGNLVKAPCIYNYQNLIWKRFRGMLTEEQRIVADSSPFKRGYFNYLHEEGLIDTYYAAKESVARDVCAHWLKVNNLNLTMNDLTLL